MGRRTAPDEPAPSRVFVDSSTWFAFASASDGWHREADQLMRQAVARRIELVTTNLVLAEVHRLVLIRMGIRAAAATLARIEAGSLLSLVHATAEHHEAAHRWLAKLADQRLSYTDAVSFAVMEALQCHTAMTFDRHFVIAGFRVWRLTSRLRS